MPQASDRDTAPEGDEAFPEEPVVYAVTLAPHRSLTPRGFRMVMMGVGGVSLVTGLGFLAMGAWPIFGFFGLDVLLIYIAFRASFRSARAREHILVTPSVIEVRREPARGRRTITRLNPFWTRLTREDDEDHGTLDVALVSGPRTVPVGRFLGPDQKAELATDLSHALSVVKKGVPRNSF
ncbi:UNVERIFIED_ORG: putative membrane protein [Xanthobacter viscosus]|jgi:uncharacterized membrane protein|uniref:DUF2244 domain-containing protein n=1 Tax=Xanthobacter autotrophicus TaxID=280 RepID=A0A6C1KXN4_XANAU|nr:DUF2244 domain-containing protein [Xanthobacter autotrophicus]TLX44523.1 DUF2244 domain-containing protein [Xanthobacter autotrophicus]